MARLAVKRVYDAPDSGDGFRVLVDRLWPRGLTKKKAALDLWAKELAPSPELRVEFNHQPEKFAEFTRRYRLELGHNPAVASFQRILKRPKVTLLYGARDAKVNHARVLAAYLSAKRKKSTVKKQRTQAAARARSR
jgi:uncharacterized protein YeaO (DUF488 family)